MKVQAWSLAVAAVAVVVLLVGCSAAAAQLKAGQSQDDQVAALTKRVDELESRLTALRWTEKDAIAVVQYKLGERLRACQPQSPGFHVYRADCDRRQDPVLKATEFHGMLGYAMVTVVLKSGKWTAVREPYSLRWRVEATGGDSWPLAFYAYERTGLVEGVVAPAR